MTTRTSAARALHIFLKDPSTLQFDIVTVDLTPPADLPPPPPR